MQSTFFKWRQIAKATALGLLVAGIITSCSKKDNINQPVSEQNNEQEAVNAARSLEQTAAPYAKKEGQ